MKEYNRKTRRWEDVEKTGKLKKPETCKGGRQHDFVLLVPKHIHRSHELFKEDILMYYAIQDSRRKSDEFFNIKLAELGITERGYYMIQKFYKCSACGKEDYR